MQGAVMATSGRSPHSPDKNNGRRCGKPPSTLNCGENGSGENRCFLGSAAGLIPVTRHLSGGGVENHDGWTRGLAKQTSR